jgi:hypothetical protein
MLKSALEGLVGHRSRHMVLSKGRGEGWAVPESDHLLMPQHLYPPSRKG